MKIRILIVDDCKRWRLFARSILEPTARFQVVGEASDGVEAITKATALLPDVVIMDIGMASTELKQPRGSGRCAQHQRFIFLTQETDLDVQNEAFATGAAA